MSAMEAAACLENDGWPQRSHGTQFLGTQYLLYPRLVSPWKTKLLMVRQPDFLREITRLTGQFLSLLLGEPLNWRKKCKMQNPAPLAAISRSSKAWGPWVVYTFWHLSKLIQM